MKGLGSEERWEEVMRALKWGNMILYLKNILTMKNILLIIVKSNCLKRKPYQYYPLL